MRTKTHRNEASEAAVRAELERVLSASRFKKSERMSRFLRYLVESKLATGTTPKEREIASNVFDKNDFDSRLDPIVRVEARRLRKMLLAYYETEGVSDPVELSLAPRGYTLRYSTKGSRSPESGREHGVSSVAVLPFLNMTNDPAQEPFCNGVTQELINALGHMDHVKVASRTSTFQYTQPQDVREICRELGVSAVLEGTVRMDDQKVRVTAELSAGDGFQYWSDTFDAPAPEGLDVQEQIASEIAGTAEQKLRTVPMD